MRRIVLWVPDWPTNSLAVDLPPGGKGAVARKNLITHVSAHARRGGVRAGMKVTMAQYLCPELIVMAEDPDRQGRAFEPVLAAFDQVAAGVECLRPGLAWARAAGPAKWAGSEEQASENLVNAVQEATGVECFVGVGDAAFAAVEAARQGIIVESEQTGQFLAAIPLRRVLEVVPPRLHQDFVQVLDLLHALGVRTCADLTQMGQRALVTRFGQIAQRLWELTHGRELWTQPRQCPLDNIYASIDIDEGGEGLDTLTLPIRRLCEGFFQRLQEAGITSDLITISIHNAQECVVTRSWRGIDLEDQDALADRIRWVLKALSDQGADSRYKDASVKSMVLCAHDPVPGYAPQGLWGTAGLDSKVLRSARRIQSLPGEQALMTPRLQGGFDPRSRVVMLPWGQDEDPPCQGGEWAGSLELSPQTLYDNPIGVELLSHSTDTSDCSWGTQRSPLLFAST
ncbi:DNA polymerase Y family protein [Schaalia vaccimaxillae]|uniref:DNA polymerase Y family protein n=1 Tax=Schaalia vaccimaxillae TaxID=183916 RepID=UPI0004020FF7|nr:hypothetical protein [Schaalia vaccimaxillae]